MVLSPVSRFHFAENESAEKIIYSTLKRYNNNRILSKIRNGKSVYPDNNFSSCVELRVIGRSIFLYTKFLNGE